MFLNKVLTGQYKQGKKEMSCLSEKTNVNGMPVLFDSAVDNVNKPSIFIIFNDSQVYAEYLVEYK
ncbi:hypothetical protein DPMN_135027 [Dreissena polymorpha]|uniref:PARP catalytic domain-containing protein n=1 Tax=Dreissena polymorpha TaxID=45954 RepID=A0A9D4JFE7_DREPO|nr:hypothetical protein DPMN_135027 [Dreissena polymorpha]